MGFIAFALIALGSLMMFVASIWILIVACQEEQYWVLLSLLCGLVLLFYVFQNFDSVKNQVMLWCGGFVISGVGYALGASVAG